MIDKKEKNAVMKIFNNNGGVLFAHGFDSIRNGHYEVRELEKKAKEYFKYLSVYFFFLFLFDIIFRKFGPRDF